MQLSPVSCYFVSLKPYFSPQHSENNCEYEKELVMIFIDYKEVVWQCENLEKFGETRNLNRYFEKMENTYEKTINCVTTNKGQSSWFETRLGIRQGSVLSPVLFNVMMNEICNKIRKRNKRKRFKSFYILR
jgi:hypothetical protein